MSKSSTYKLLKVSGGITLFAEVTISISENISSSGIVISERVFDWLKEAYGPEAIMWPVNVNNDFVRGARKGIEHVIKCLPSGHSKSRIGFTVEKIVATEIDSTIDTVAYAACLATWKALGIEPVSQPKIEGRQIIFE